MDNNEMKFEHGGYNEFNNGISLKKGSRLIEQFCVYDHMRRCGRDCPHFDEPKEIMTPHNGYPTTATGEWELSICHGKVIKLGRKI